MGYPLYPCQGLYHNSIVSGPVEPCLPAGWNWDSQTTENTEEELGVVRGASGEVRGSDHFKSVDAGQGLVDS